MAAIKPTVVKTGHNCVVVSWTPVTEADTCVPAPLEIADYGDRSVQVSGTAGGTSVALHGSNDNSKWAALKNPASTTIALAADGALSAVLEGTAYVKPVLTGGTGTSLTINLFARRGRGGKEA